MKITKKEYNQEFNNIIKEFNLNKKDKRHKIETIYGAYTFIFSDDTIFGRFDNVELIKDINNLNILSKTVNIYSGKFNFHFDDVFIFIENLNKIKL
jgi:hypothetical protein